jgi:hypothetical protein
MSGGWRDFAVQSESHEQNEAGAKMIWWKTSFWQHCASTELSEREYVVWYSTGMFVAVLLAREM